jgi:hypothetical protein
MTASTPSVRPALIVLTLGALLLPSAACTSSGEASSSWSRSYLAPRDRVIDTVAEVLEDENYLVEVDRTTGRIEAQPSREKTGQRNPLVVRVKERKDRVWVDVQSRSQMDREAMSQELDQGPILEFFHELDLRMQGTRD